MINRTVHLLLLSRLGTTLCTSLPKWVVGWAWDLEVASHQILCPYQLLKIVDMVLGRSFFNKNLASSRLWTSSWVRHILDITSHIMGTRGLIKMCSFLVPMTHLTRSFAQSQNLCLAILWVGTIWRSFIVAYVSGDQHPLLGPTYLGYTFHFCVGLECRTFGN